MSSGESSSTEVPAAGGPLSPRGPLALALGSVVVLAVLVWSMAPRRSEFTPAPLKPAPEECPHLVRDFLPSNVTELAEPPLRGMDEPWKVRAFRRLNFEPCPCGCNRSLAACRVEYPQCPRSKVAAEEIIRAAREQN